MTKLEDLLSTYVPDRVRNFVHHRLVEGVQIINTVISMTIGPRPNPPLEDLTSASWELGYLKLRHIDSGADEGGVQISITGRKTYPSGRKVQFEWKLTLSPQAWESIYSETEQCLLAQLFERFSIDFASQQELALAILEPIKKDYKETLILEFGATEEMVENYSLFRLLY